MEVLTRGGGGGITNVDRSSRVITIQSKKTALFKTLYGEIVYLVERNKTRLKTIPFSVATAPTRLSKISECPPPRPVLNNSNINFNSVL